MVETPDVYEPEAGERVSETVVRALADSRGTDPLDLDDRLYDAIDPDALDGFFEESGDATGRRIAFSTHGRRIVVDEARRVYVTYRDQSLPDQPGLSGPGILRGASSPWRMVFSE